MNITMICIQMYYINFLRQYVINSFTNMENDENIEDKIYLYKYICCT